MNEKLQDKFLGFGFLFALFGTLEIIFSLHETRFWAIALLSISLLCLLVFLSSHFKSNEEKKNE